MNMWRKASRLEKALLEKALPEDFEIVLGFNTKAYWVVYNGSDCASVHLLTGWFDTEKDAQDFVNDFGYRRKTTTWATDFDMDI